MRESVTHSGVHAGIDCLPRRLFPDLLPDPFGRDHSVELGDSGKGGRDRRDDAQQVGEVRDFGDIGKMRDHSAESGDVVVRCNSIERVEAVGQAEERDGKVDGGGMYRMAAPGMSDGSQVG